MLPRAALVLYTMGSNFGDLNNDGFLDFDLGTGDPDFRDIHMNMGSALEGDVYQNLFCRNPGFEGNWLTVRLLGEESNRMAIGARITAVVREEDGTRQIHRVVGSGGSFGGNPFRQHLGLGVAPSVERLVIEWPTSGIVQTFTEVAPNRIIEITEGVDEIRELELPAFEYRLEEGRRHAHTEGAEEG